MFKSYITVLLVVAIAATSAWAQTSEVRRPQLIRFFTTANCAPPASVSQPPYYNYTDHAIVNATTPTYNSYCVIRGAWRVEMNNAPTDFKIAIGDGCAMCHKKATGTNVRYGTIRRIGGADVSQAWIYLYKDGQAGYAEEGVALNGFEYTLNATYSFTSIAFSSYNNWTWQLYNSPRFRGSSECLRPNYGSDITMLTKTVNVGSIRVGCRNSGTNHHRQSWLILTLLSIFMSFYK